MTRSDTASASSPPPMLRGLWRDFKRVALFTLLRLFALFVTVVVAVYLTVVIANMGGELDKLRISQIRMEVTEQLTADEQFAFQPRADQEAQIETLVQDQIERLRLDEPFIYRSFDYLYRAIILDLGRAERLTSASGSDHVSQIILERLPATILLFGVANVLVFVVAIFVALFLSRRYGSALDRTVVALAPTSAAPGWFYGIFLILFFAFLIPLFPSGRMVDPSGPTGIEYYGSVLYHMILPVTAMFIASIFISIYSWRTFFLIHSSEDYVEMARAKGLPSRMIERRYVLRPALPPIVTSFALMLITLWSGAIILEQVFSWPGLGTTYMRAIGQTDTPVIVGFVVIYAYLLAATVFLLDIAYAILDPRVKLGGK